MATVLQNGVNFDASQIQILLAGAPFVTIRSIGYRYTRERKDTRGMGAEPVSAGFGSKMYVGEDIEVLRDEFLAFVAATAPNGDITAIPLVQIKIVFNPQSYNPNANVITLQNVSFTGAGSSIKSGDTQVYVKIPFSFAGITEF